MRWCCNANAAKARKRLESPAPVREPKMTKAALPWEITIRNLIDGQEATFQPRSGRHAKRVIDVVFAHYVAEQASSVRKEG